ncbi:PREDICTED: uncharacterized protein LOC108368801 [Rhagoletis zephyria]|uniref:uncharacterized protein LOC108368801 n=2 Tax=Rhagoletis TaxID=28609 RepID=UPI000811794B|nr:PREDICTED: uncharacterized protein LOC108368801 [Rhagoletis zephyria]
MLAQNQLIRECKVMLKKVQQSVCYMTGETEDENIREISSLLHLNSKETSIQMEAKISNAEYRQALSTYIYKLKGPSGCLNDVIRKLFTDEFLQHYNWDGRWERESLAQMKLVDEILFGVFKSEG